MHQNFTPEPVCCFITLMFALYRFLGDFLNRLSALTSLFRCWAGGLTVSNVPSDYWWGALYKSASFRHRGNHDERSFPAVTQRGLMHPQTVMVSCFFVSACFCLCLVSALWHREQITKGNFSARCSGHWSRYIFSLIICDFCSFFRNLNQSYYVTGVL